MRAVGIAAEGGGCSMSPEELKRIREWCYQQMATRTNPHLLAEIVKLCDEVAILEAGGRPEETDAEIQAFAERMMR
jgi:hypothetical protein